MKALKNIYSVFSNSDKKNIGYLFIGVLITGLFEVAGIASIAPFMAVVTTPDLIHSNQYLSLIYNYFDFNGDAEFLIAFGVGVVLLLVITNIFSAFVVWRLTLFVYLLSHRLSVKLLENYLNKPYQFFLENNTIELGKNVLFEIARGVNSAVLPALLTLSKAIIIILIVGLLLMINPQLVLIAAAVLGGAYVLIYMSLSSQLLKEGEVAVTSTSAKFKYVTEAFSAIKELKLYDKNDDFVSQYFIESQIFAKANTNQSMISQIPKYFVETVAFGGIIFLIIFLISKGQRFSEVIPMVSVFALAAYRLIPALQQSYSHISNIKYNSPILEILARDLNDTNVRNIAKNTVQTLPNKDINIINLSYSYQNSNKLILKKISLTIKKNTTVGIVGLTGSGKTTLINLIMGLITPISGSISVGKTVLDDTSMASWQKNIGYVPQDIFLMDDTIKNNIIFSNALTDINIDEVIHAAKLAGISSFIESLPQGYDTKVGERGVRLSGGQVQRIGIARALYRKPSVIVFDEATNALDGITEKILIETIHKISHQKTIIMIAHRLTSVKRCDSIHLIENGIISESGSYEQLISKESSFKKMVDSHG